MQTMSESSAVAPPYVGRPLRLHPFQARSLAPRQIGTSRALARPYRERPARLAARPRTPLLLEGGRPAVHLHEYSAGGLTIRGLVGTVDLARRAPARADSALLPHEGIHAERVSALADRMLELRMQPAPILLVHRGPEQVRSLIRHQLQRSPDRAFTDRSQQHHRFWALDDPADLELLTRELGGATPLIADGHHRYAAALQLQESHPGTGWDRGLAMLVDQDDTPLFLGAIHRVLSGVTLTALTALAGRRGWPTQLRSERSALDRLGPTTLVVTDGTRWATLALPVPAGEAAVDVLHDLVLPALSCPPGAVGYHHSVALAVRQVRRGGGLAVLMPAPDFDLVHHLVAHARLLPEKATSFQPKPSVGAIIRSLPDG